MNWKKQYQKALTFSYDDGNVQDKKLLDILNRYGMKCTFNVNTGLDFDHGTWVYRDVLEVHRLNLAECPELYAGHEMAVHGVYHYNLTELSPAELTAELQENADWGHIFCNLGFFYTVLHFVWHFSLDPCYLCRSCKWASKDWFLYL